MFFKRSHEPWSLAARLTAWYAGASFVLVFSSSVFVYVAIVTHLDREDDAFLAEKVHLLRVLLTENAADPRALEKAVEGDAASRPFGHIGVRILDTQGQVLLETPGLSLEVAAEEFPCAVPLDNGPLHGAEYQTPAGKSFRFVAVRTWTGNTERILQLAFDRTSEEALLARYRWSLMLVLALALVGCAVAGYQIARRGLRPLTEIAAAAQRVSSAHLRERLHLGGLPAEVATLAETLNAMLDRLQESFDRLSQFSADIAHELRTPLNNLRGEVEVALGQPRSPHEYREVLGSCLEECGRVAALVDSLLFLARAEIPQTSLVHERIDVMSELEGLRDFYEAAASEAGVQLEVEGQPATVTVDRTLFQRALGNLVANALAHTPAGGKVTVHAQGNGAEVRLHVTDTGRGIAPEHLPHVFDRFFRADEVRTTTSGRVGLGLAIVKSIAELHGGRVTIDSQLGMGTRVTLVLHGSREKANPDG